MQNISIAGKALFGLERVSRLQRSEPREANTTVKIKSQRKLNTAKVMTWNL
jgi:hypothetical protein